MKRITICAATAILSAASLSAQAPMSFQPPSWGSSGVSHIEGAQAGPIAGRPVSGKETRRTTQVLSDGTQVDHTDVSYFCRDSVGRMRAESADRVEIFDPVSRMEYDLNPKNKTYRKFPFATTASSMTVAVVGGTSWTSFSSDPPRSPRSNEDLGRQNINGLWAKGSRVTDKVPPGTFGNNREISIVNEQWYSEDLQLLIRSSNRDPRFGLNVYELTNIDQSAPNPALFTPPSDYKLVSADNR
jgi:hypothetical protein